MPLKFYQSFDIKEKDFDELLCTKCARNGSSVDTLSFCVGCQSLFCFQCLQEHKRDEANSDWTADDADTYSINNGNVYGKLENMFNKRYTRNTNSNHNQMKYQHKEIKQSLLSLQKQLQSHIKYHKAETENRVQKIKEEAKRKVTDLRIKVMDLMEEFQTHIEEELKEFHQDIEKAYSEKATSVEILMAKTEAALEKLKGAKTTEDIDYIADFTKQTKSEAKKVFEDPDNHYASFIKWITKAEIDNANAIFTESMDELLGNINALGKCLTEDNSSLEHPQSKFYNVEGPSDTTICDINGSCIMPDGSVLLTDWNNKNIKHVNQIYQVIDTCDLPGIPWAVCCTGKEEAAVTLHYLQRVQFVSFSEDKMRLTDSFKVRQKCRGVACANNLIFVSCGGGGILDGIGRINVYNRQGTILETFELGNVGNNLFSCPQHITVKEDGTFLYIADKNFRIITRDLQKKIPAETYPRALERKQEEVKGICLKGDFDIIVCDFTLNTVALYSNVVEEGTSVKTLLDRKDDICNPQSLCYNTNKKQLVVTSGNNNFIQIFEM